MCMNKNYILMCILNLKIIKNYVNYVGKILQLYMKYGIYVARV